MMFPRMTLPRLAMAFAVLLAAQGFAVADDANPQHTCEPWPNCQLDSLVIKPGAPNTGLRPQGARPAAPPDDDRGLLRLPKPPDK
jgi:hypothetical protein